VIFGLILALASAVATNLAFLFKQRGAVVAPPILVLGTGTATYAGLSLPGASLPWTAGSPLILPLWEIPL
jgi:hypothetical protein